jgi:hypothetical protein
MDKIEYRAVIKFFVKEGAVMENGTDKGRFNEFKHELYANILKVYASLREDMLQSDYRDTAVTAA